MANSSSTATVKSRPDSNPSRALEICSSGVSFWASPTARKYQTVSGPAWVAAADANLQRMDADDVLVRRAQRGERFAFERLVEPHEQRMYTLAARVLGSREDAADAVQEALLRAWLALPKFRGDARFSTWLYRIVVNAAHDVRAKRRERRSRSRRPRRPTGPLRRAGALRGAPAGADGLDESYRVAVVLYDVLGCSYAEIAEMTGVPEGTVKSRIFRGRSELAERLGTTVELTESND